MVQIIQEKRRRPSSAQVFAESAVPGLSQAFSQYQQGRKQKELLAQENELVKKNYGIDLSGIQDPETRKAVMIQSLKGEQQGQLQNRKLEGNFEADEENFNTVKNIFGDKFANAWKASPTGGRTKLLQAALEAKQRGYNLDDLLSGEQSAENQSENFDMANEQQFQPENFQEIQENIPAQKPVNVIKNVKQHVKEQDTGLLPSEKISRGKERFDTGYKQYQEATTKLRSMARDKERLDILSDLEKSNKLPKDFGRLNVDAEGNLRFPFAASPESQRFVKTLNEFSQGAKDTFGSRVTNFDLQQYLKRFPTLLNTAEGRKQISQQMKIVNQINSIHYKNLKKVYDEAGGVRNIDADVAERFAEEMSENEVNNLADKFKEIGQFSSKPAAQEFKGKKIRDKDTGEIFISDGFEWKPFEGGQ